MKDLILAKLHYHEDGVVSQGSCIWFSRTAEDSLHSEGAISLGGQDKPYGSTDMSLAVSVRDVNGDGLADITTGANWYFAPRRVYLNAGTAKRADFPKYEDLQLFEDPNQDSFAEYGDLNGDGLTDIVSFVNAGFENTYFRRMKFRLYINGGTAALPNYLFSGTEVVFSGTAQRSFNGAVGDLNGDGLADLIETSGNGKDTDVWGKQVIVHYNTSEPAADTIKPTVKLISPSGSIKYSIGDSMTIEWRAEDNIAVDSVTVSCSYDGRLTWKMIAEKAFGDVIAWKIPERGTFTIRIRAVDKAGNETVLFSNPLNAETVSMQNTCAEKRQKISLHGQTLAVGNLIAPAVLRIVGFNGKVLRELTVSAGNSIDLRSLNLSSGAYCVQIISRDAAAEVLRFQITSGS